MTASDAELLESIDPRYIAHTKLVIDDLVNDPKRWEYFLSLKGRRKIFLPIPDTGSLAFITVTGKAFNALVNNKPVVYGQYVVFAENEAYPR